MNPTTRFYLFAAAWWSVCSFSLRTFGAADFNFSNPSLETGTDGSAGAVYRFSDVNDANTLDMILTLESIGANSGSPTGVVVGPNNAGQNVGNSVYLEMTDTASVDPYIEIVIKFINADDAHTASAVTIPTLNVQGFDLDSRGTNTDQIDIFGYHNSLAPTVTTDPTTVLEQGGWSNGGGVADYNMYRIDPATSGNITDWTDEGSVDNGDLVAQIPYTVSFTFSNFSEGRFAVGLTGSHTTDTPRAWYLNMSDPPYVPTVVPEPASLVLSAIALGLGFGLVKLRRRRR